MSEAHRPCWRGECQRSCYYPETCSEERAIEPTRGETYYIEHGWSGCAGSRWSTLTDAAKDGWRAAARATHQSDQAARGAWLTAECWLCGDQVDA